MGVGRARIRDDTLSVGLEGLPEKHMEVIGDILHYWGLTGTSEMKANARWTDRTSNARNGLRFRVTQTKSNTTLTYFGSMPYNIWLEVRWSGKYAIIGPTMSSVIPRLKVMLEQVFD
jgi:hypothetical protein